VEQLGFNAVELEKAGIALDDPHNGVKHAAAE
jgi:hypothetical protein